MKPKKLSQGSLSLVEEMSGYDAQRLKVDEWRYLLRKLIEHVRAMEAQYESLRVVRWKKIKPPKK